jgi:hypothetical protein
MPEKILYLLGAGASANILPLAKNRYNKTGKISKPGLIEEIKTFDLKRLFLDYNLETDLAEMVKTI